MLARYGAERPLPCWQPLKSEVSELEALLRRREEVQGLLQQERNRWQQVQGRPGMHQAVPECIERVDRRAGRSFITASRFFRSNGASSQGLRNLGKDGEKTACRQGKKRETERLPLQPRTRWRGINGHEERASTR